MKDNTTLHRGKQKKSIYHDEIGAPIDFSELDDEARLRGLQEIFDCEEFKHLMQVRDSALFQSMRSGRTDKVANARFEAASQMVAQLIGEGMMYCAHVNGSRIKKMGVKKVLDGIKQDDKERVLARQKFYFNANAVVFMSDLLDMYASNIQDCLDKLFPGQGARYGMLDDVARMRKRLSTYFDHTCRDGSEEQRMLFADYAESINNYMDKRINSFIRKSDALRKKESKAKSKEKSEEKNKS